MSCDNTCSCIKQCKYMLVPPCICPAKGVRGLLCFIYLPEKRWVCLCVHEYCDFKFQAIEEDSKDFVCVCVCARCCASDLGLRHNIEVVVIRGESHVSEDGPVVHCLNRLVLQGKRRSIYPDLEDRNRHKKTPHITSLLSLVVHSGCLAGIKAKTKIRIHKKSRNSVKFSVKVECCLKR